MTTIRITHGINPAGTVGLDKLTEENEVQETRITTEAKSNIRLWLERCGIGLIAAVSLLLPLATGMMFYLAITDGIAINSGDPFHETRLWMIQEARGATGLGLSIAMPSNSIDSVPCAFTTVRFLKWDRSLRLESDASYCRCYELKNGSWADTNVTCR